MNNTIRLIIGVSLVLAFVSYRFLSGSRVNQISQSVTADMSETTQIRPETNLADAVQSQLASLLDHAHALQEIKAIPTDSLRHDVADLSIFPEDDLEGVDQDAFQECNPFHIPPVHLHSFYPALFSKDRTKRIRQPENSSLVYVLTKGDPFQIVDTLVGTTVSSRNKTYHGSPPYQNDISCEFSIDLHQRNGTTVRYEISPNGFVLSQDKLEL